MYKPTPQRLILCFRKLDHQTRKLNAVVLSYRRDSIRLLALYSLGHHNSSGYFVSSPHPFTGRPAPALILRLDFVIPLDGLSICRRRSLVGASAAATRLSRC